MDKFKEKLKGLTMQPEDWTKLHSLTDEDTYRKVVNEYQNRERLSLPKCGQVFRVCRYYDPSNERCFCKDYCKAQRKA